MLQVLPLFHEEDQHGYTETLDGAQFELTLTYRERRKSWYLDLDDANGVPLVRGRRCSPGFPLVPAGIVGRPAGILTCDAPNDPYKRSELRLIYYPAADVATS